MYTKVRIHFAFVIMLLSFLAGISLAAKGNAKRSENFAGVDYKKGLLRISVKNQKLIKVIDEVSKKTGVQIAINRLDDAVLTIEFDYLPLERSLKRLLKDKNSVFIYSSKETEHPAKLVKILVFPKSGESTVAGLDGITASKTSDQTEQTEAMKEMLNLNQQMLNEVLQNLPRNEVDLRIELNSAMEQLQDSEGFQEMTRQIEEALKSLALEDVNLQNNLTDALKGSRNFQRTNEKNR
jgi:hypothetical protein